VTSPVGKTRTREHVLADLSINHVERQILLCGFAVDRVQHDYGYDLTMYSFDASNAIEPGQVYIQVKGTDDLPWIASGKIISWSVSQRDLKLWLQETYPVVLAVYDGQQDKAYWIHIQAYIGSRGTAELFARGQTTQVHILAGKRFNPRAVHTIAQCKNDIHNQWRGKASRHA
jgi:hypothetical protein